MGNQPAFTRRPDGDFGLAGAGWLIVSRRSIPQFARSFVSIDLRTPHALRLSVCDHSRPIAKFTREFSYIVPEFINLVLWRIAKSLSQMQNHFLARKFFYLCSCSPT
ncbi:hypothetical protein HYPGJ_30595 [Hyphomicrobium sp. GJ21]|nr:hypothetical protein HYPGJ_30595 [Hyphomicrobium sp. GJ21]